MRKLSCRKNKTFAQVQDNLKVGKLGLKPQQVGFKPGLHAASKITRDGSFRSLKLASSLALR